MRTGLIILAAWLLAPAALLCAAAAPAARPNILVILADDLGYADVGFHGCKDIPTPNLDRLARSGVRCTGGYVTHPFCSPTRAGLLAGRCQQRFGHENNPAWLPESTVAGLPLSQTTLPQVLRTAGYRTGCVGKWHLGAHPQFHPNRRGFDEYFGLRGGGHIYTPGAKGSVEYLIPMDRNGQPEPLTEYLTTVLAREGAAFVRRQRDRPWFLYLAFNAPHTPLQITDSLRERVRHITDETRRGYAGLVVGLDDAVGVVMDALRESGQVHNTLVFFLSDNGGPVSVTHSDNAPLRGAKGQVFEGGIRVPFVVSWPGRLPQGKDYAQPVSSLDIFATAVALTDTKVPAGHALEGTNILPYLTGERTGTPRDRLFWRTGGGATYAVREGDWKLVGGAKGEIQLFNLAADIGESRDLAAQQPDVLTRLRQAYADWNKDNVAPLFQSPQPNQSKAAKKAKAK
ncbi:MAG: sulfatase-like hydrolase/transferase [Planctomycetes bacterium]|nr:sulfatase-like hydrolase/transferase [Planctomycetota bacterium]